MAEGNTMKGYVCPCCRLLVSASIDMLGEEGQCPGCLRFIRIPRVEDGANVSVVKPVIQTMGAYVHVHQFGSDMNWREDLPVEVLAAKSEGLPWMMLIPSFILGSSLFVGLIILLFYTNLGPSEVIPVNSAYAELNETALEVREKAPTTDEVLELLTRISEVKKVSGLTVLLRDVPKLKDKVKSYYKNKQLSFYKPMEVLEVKTLLNSKGVYVFRAYFEDGVSRSGVVEKRGRGEWRLDWESFIGYCELEWEKIPEIQPKKTTLVRAVRVKTEYYNQGFNSDEWQSFELNYPGSEVSLIGYTPRDSELMYQLLPIGNELGALDVTLMIRYPEKVYESRIVLIDEMLESSWVEVEPKQIYED